MEASRVTFFIADDSPNLRFAGEAAEVLARESYLVAMSSEWDEFQAELAKARFGVAFTPLPGTPDALRRLGAGRPAPVLVVGGASSAGTPHLWAHATFARLRPERISTDLVRLVGLMLMEDLPLRIRDAARTQRILQAYPRAMNGLLLVTSDKCRSVQRLGRLLGCGRRQLEREWHGARLALCAAGAGTPLPRLDRVVRVFTLLRILVARFERPAERVPWRVLADIVQIAPRTLFDLVADFLNKRPSEIEIRDATAFVTRVEAELLAALGPFERWAVAPPAPLAEDGAILPVGARVCAGPGSTSCHIY